MQISRISLNKYISAPLKTKRIKEQNVIKMNNSLKCDTVSFRGYNDAVKKQYMIEAINRFNSVLNNLDDRAKEINEKLNSVSADGLAVYEDAQASIADVNKLKKYWKQHAGYLDEFIYGKRRVSIKRKVTINQTYNLDGTIFYGGLNRNGIVITERDYDNNLLRETVYNDQGKMCYIIYKDNPESSDYQQIICPNEEVQAVKKYEFKDSIIQLSFICTTETLLTVALSKTKTVAKRF